MGHNPCLPPSISKLFQALFKVLQSSTKGHIGRLVSRIRSQNWQWNHLWLLLVPFSHMSFLLQGVTASKRRNSDTLYREGTIDQDYHII